MTRWSYVDVSVTILEIAIDASVCSEAPWNSGGYSIEPTPTMTPWPCMSRGIEWLVPMPPGLVRLTVVPWKSMTSSLLLRALVTMVS